MGSRSTAGRHEPLRFLSLCSGIGGIDLAAEMAGMRIVGQVEIDPYCRRVLAKHWPDVKRVDDIRKVWGYDFGSVDVVAGGIPCQPFSVAGKRRGASDDRYLWPEMLRIVQIYEPAWVIVENVAGFVGLALDRVLTDLGAAGYETRAFVLPAAAVGAPHLRERCFVVAHADSGRCGRFAPAIRGSADKRQAPGRTSGNREVGVGQADANGERWEEGKPSKRSRTQQSDGRDGSHVADATHGGLRCGQPSRDGGQSALRGQDLPDPERQSLAFGCERPARQALTESAGVPTRQAQSRVGGDPDGLPRRLDGGRRDDDGDADAFTEYPRHCWPSGPSEPQAPWEPPRTVTGTVRDRAARLKALGNAVVPQQVFPILAAIVAAEREASHASA